MQAILQQQQVKANRMGRFSTSNNRHKIWVIRFQLIDILEQVWEEIISRDLTAAQTTPVLIKAIWFSLQVEEEIPTHKVVTPIKTIQEAIAEVIIKDHLTKATEDIKTS